MKWTDWHLPLVAVDTDKGVAELLGGPRASWMDEPDARYWVENVPDALDQPGEWYLDTQTGWLRYLAPKGLRLNRVPVVAARLTELVRVEGDPGSVESVSESVVQGVTFSGITFAETDDGIPSEGLQSPQSAVPIRGAFRATHATDCVIEDCTFANLGGYALELGQDQVVAITPELVEVATLSRQPKSTPKFHILTSDELKPRIEAADALRNKEDEEREARRKERAAASNF
jgi:hypothetical protein